MRKILESVVVGIIFGLLTHLAGKYLPADWQFFVNTKLIWLIPVFLIALNLPIRRWAKDSIIVSTITLAITGLTFYTSELIKNNQSFYFTDSIIKFLIITAIVGPITGYVAYLARSATKDFVRYASISILPALYTGEGIDGIISNINNFTWTPEIATKLFGGFLFYIILSGNNKFKPKSALSYLILTGIATLCIYFIPNMI